MSFRENEQQRSRHTLRKHAKQQKRHKKKKQQQRQPALDAPLTALHDSQVLTFHEWCRLNRFSERTGRRILNSGTGPVVTQLSARRIGVTVGNNAAWQAAKARG